VKLVFVNYTTETFSPTAGGSLSTYIWELCQVAAARGVRPTVITQAHDKERYAWPETLYVDPPELPRNAWLYRVERLKRKLSRWPHLRQWVYAERVVEAIRSHGLEQAAFVFQNDVELAEVVRRRFPESRLVVLFQNYHPAKRRRPGELARTVNAVAAVSDATARWVERTYGLGAGTVATVYNGVDVERFAPKRNGSAGRPVINFTGRICPEKGPDVLLRSCLAVSRRCSEFDVQLLGWSKDRPARGEFEKELQAQASELERRGVRFRNGGWVARQDLPGRLAAAQVHVTPSRWEEAFGLTTLEAMASGLAVVATRTGGTPEVVGSAGRLFEKDDAAALSGHLEELIGNVRLRRDLGERARVRALTFTWQHTWDAMSKVVSAC
jgi:glycosyltransferase involved in cell wall biosynthesis